MVEEVDIYSDLHQGEVPSPVSHSDHTELDLLDVSVVPRQASPVKKGCAVANGRQNAVKEHRGGIAQSRQKLALQRMTALRKENAILRHNVSLLYATAKELISAKDKEIASLRSRLDNLIFRRNNYGSARDVEKPRGANESKPSPSAHSSSRDQQPPPEDSRSKERPRPNGKYDLSSDLKTLYCLHKTKPSLQKELKDVKYLEPFKADVQSNHRNEAAVGERLGTPPVSNAVTTTSSPSVHLEEKLAAPHDDRRKRRRSNSPSAHRPCKEARRDCSEVSSDASSSRTCASPCSQSLSNADSVAPVVSRKEVDSKEHRVQKRRESPRRASESTSRLGSSTRRHPDERTPSSDSRAEWSRCLEDRESQRSSRRGLHGNRFNAETGHSKPHSDRIPREYPRHRKESPRRKGSRDRAAEIRDFREVDSREQTAKSREHKETARFASRKEPVDKGSESRLESEGRRVSSKEREDCPTSKRREESRGRTEIEVNRRDRPVTQRERRNRSSRLIESDTTHHVKSEEGIVSRRIGPEEHDRSKFKREGERALHERHKSERQHQSTDSTKQSSREKINSNADQVQCDTSVSVTVSESAAAEKRCSEKAEEGEIFSD